jgi:hypothetical protein
MLHILILLAIASLSTCSAEQNKKRDLDNDYTHIKNDPVFIMMRHFCERKNLRLCKDNNLLKFFHHIVYDEQQTDSFVTEAPETTMPLSENLNEKEEQHEEIESAEKQVKGKELVKNILKDFHQIFSE